VNLTLQRIKLWEEECYGFVMWSVDSIVSNYKSLNRPGPVTVIDIGANVGKVTDLLLDELDVKEAYLFEPIPVLYEYMVKKYIDNKKIKIFNCALSDINTPTFPIDQQYLLNQLNDSYTNEYLNLGVSKYCISPEATLVKCIRLSTFLNNNPHLYNENLIIKIDTENQDFSILKDFQTVLTSFKNAPLVEFEINFFGGSNLTESQCQDVLDKLHNSKLYNKINLKDSMKKGKGDEILIPC
jgi:FkbM family methyltransferase